MAVVGFEPAAPTRWTRATGRHLRWARVVAVCRPSVFYTGTPSPVHHPHVDTQVGLHASSFIDILRSPQRHEELERDMAGEGGEQEGEGRGGRDNRLLTAANEVLEEQAACEVRAACILQTDVKPVCAQPASGSVAAI